MKNSIRNTNTSTAVLILIGMAVAGITFSSSGQESRSRTGLLITTSGTVVRGRISNVGSGYAVELPTGTVTYPFSTIICEAQTLQEAYRKQRDAMTRPTTDQHIRLANWAFEQKLFAEAERELHSALNLQPNNLTAKRLLRKFDSQEPKDSEFVDQYKKQTMDNLMIQQAFSQAKPLGNLSPELAKEFATMIEPLLINRCSNGSCHGVSVTHDFRLQRKWNVRGNSRHITEKNLRAVLNQINIARPDQSPLTKKLNGQHGLRKTNVFAGPKSQQHLRILQNWVLRAGIYLQEQVKEDKTTFTQLVDQQPESESNSKVQQAGFNSPGNQPPNRLPVPAQKPSRLEEIRKEQANDPFNPEIFNQKVHGK